MQTDTPDTILRIQTVLKRTGLSRSTMYRKMENGTGGRLNRIGPGIGGRCARLLGTILA